MAKVIEHLPQRPVAVGGGDRRTRGSSQPQPVMTLKVLARDDLREIVRRLALGDRPGTAFEPVPAQR